MKNFAIYYLLIIIVPAFTGMTILFLCGLSAFVAQTTVLISVNPCLKESDLKKQSQFAVG